MYKGLTVSVVIPCFNEEHGIAAVLRSLPDFVDQVVVVDNNSTDETASVARELGADVTLEKKKGYGNAYKAGFPKATGDIVATTDGDGTYPTNAIAPIIDHLLERDLDFVSASRFPLVNRNAMRFRNVLGNKILTYVTRLLWLRWVADSQSGMWVFRRKILDYARPSSGGMPFSEELKIEVWEQPHLVFGEYHIEYHERIGETKLFAWKDGFENLFFLFKRRLRNTPFERPLRRASSSRRARARGRDRA